MARTSFTRIAAVIGAWTLFGVVEGCQSFFVRALGPEPVSLAYALRISLPRWWLWAGLTPLIIWFCRLVPIQRRRLVRSVSAHVVFGTLMSGIALLLGGLIYYTAVYQGGGSLGDLLPAYFGAHSAMAIVAYGAVAGACHAWDYHVRLVAREVQAARAAARASALETSLTRARLDTLRGQLQPHFLFNTLNTVSALALKGRRQDATRVVALLSDLLRVSLDTTGGQTVPLASEVDFVERYLEIERARFGSRIEARIAVAPGLGGVHVPSLFLQPLVENALRHGIGPHSEGGVVRVTADRASGGALRIIVEDSGRGFPDDLELGVGLGSTRLRLEGLYGPEAGIHLDRSELGGARVAVTIPGDPGLARDPSAARGPVGGSGRRERMAT